MTTAHSTAAAPRTGLALIPALLDRAPARSQGLGKLGAALVGSWLIAACAQAQVPMWPVPATLQTFAVVLLGAALGSRWGALSVAMYLAQGAAGLPFFAGGAAGLAHFAGPTGGYLLAFPAGAWIVGALSERGWTRRAWTTAAAMLLGEVAILAVGAGWLSGSIGARAALTTGMLFFLPWAAVKAALAAAALPMAWRLAGVR
ncbi:MAG: biotin transporter BioY [Phycisphaerales bacterium]|nr:biotin transporter BioY [Phycisphaerales bacterium]